MIHVGDLLTREAVVRVAIHVVDHPEQCVGGQVLRLLGQLQDRAIVCSDSFATEEYYSIARRIASSCLQSENGRDLQVALFPTASQGASLEANEIIKDE